MSWAHIDTHGFIKEHGQLPKNWQNVSNLFALENDPEILASLGWYKVVDDTVPITNDRLEYHGEPQYTWDSVSNVVRKNCPILYRDEPITSPVIVPDRDLFFIELRLQRNQKLLESDWTQTVDLQNIKDSVWIAAWATYRQQLRDLPEFYMQAQNSHIVSVDQVTWPWQP